MAGETTLTIIGNTTAPAELRFTPAGAAVANFTVASTPRTFDKQTNDWKDGATLFMRCSVWREQAENIAETLTDKGMRVVVTGRLTQREYEKDGQKRTVVELEAEEVAPSLRYASAKVTRTQRKAEGNNNGGGTSSGWGNQPTNSEPPF
jgi:single-strand DNA-binding protein